MKEKIKKTVLISLNNSLKKCEKDLLRFNKNSTNKKGGYDNKFDKLFLNCTKRFIEVEEAYNYIFCEKFKSTIKVEDHNFTREQANRQIKAMFNIDISDFETSEVLKLSAILYNIDHKKKTPNERFFPGVFNNEGELEG